jgi:hypothetical protein
MPPLFGIVLSQVPTHAGGLGSGLLITTQQMFLGLGSAVVGSVFPGLLRAHPEPQAFQGAVLPLAAVMLAVAALTRLLRSG